MLPELTDVPQTRQTTDNAPACRATRAVRLQIIVRMRWINEYHNCNGKKAMQHNATIHKDVLYLGSVVIDEDV